jgi:hypothetical protein
MQQLEGLAMLNGSCSLVLAIVELVFAAELGLVGMAFVVELAAVAVEAAVEVAAGALVAVAGDTLLVMRAAAVLRDTTLTTAVAAIAEFEAQGGGSGRELVQVKAPAEAPASLGCVTKIDYPRHR